jgi:hypothetical protein
MRGEIAMPRYLNIVVGAVAMVALASPTGAPSCTGSRCQHRIHVVFSTVSTTGGHGSHGNHPHGNAHPHSGHGHG